MVVRRLGPSDWALLRDVRLRALSDAPYAFGSTFEEESQRGDAWWKSSVERFEWHEGVTLAWFVAEEGDELVGIVAGLPPNDEEDCPEIISMWVDPRRRGSGIADRLLTAAVDWAIQEGAQTISLGVADGNERARRFYQRAGFVATGRSEPLRSNPSVRTRELRLELG